LHYKRFPHYYLRKKKGLHCVTVEEEPISSALATGGGRRGKRHKQMEEIPRQPDAPALRRRRQCPLHLALQACRWFRGPLSRRFCAHFALHAEEAPDVDVPPLHNSTPRMQQLCCCCCFLFLFSAFPVFLLKWYRCFRLTWLCETTPDSVVGSELRTWGKADYST
jgi:hypothetical protein